MNKYSILSIFNIFVGAFLIALSERLLATILTLSDSDIYSMFNTTPPSYTTAYLGIGMLFLLAIVNFYMAFKLNAKSTQNKDAVYQYGLITLLVTFVLCGIFVEMTVTSTILPIYNLTNQF